MDLKAKRCLPCEGDMPKLTPAQLGDHMAQLVGWELRDEKLHKAVSFSDFVANVAFINRMAALAEDEGHHPDFCVHYNRLDLTIWTHAVGGLSENDLILAAKIDELLAAG